MDEGHLRVVRAPPSEPPQRPRWWQGPGMRLLLVLCAVATVLHLVPLLLPRNMPEQELAIARVTPSVEARVELLSGLKDNRKATAAHLREAAELVLEGASGKAYEWVREAERREPTSVETQLLLARVCEVERRERCVREALGRAVQLAPTDARPDLLRADLRERVGDLEGAADAVGSAYRKAPGDAAVAVRYGRLLSETGRFGEAEAVLKALGGDVAAPRLLVELGLVKVRQGREEEARALFSRAVEAEPRLAVGHYYLGLTLHRLGQTQAAEESLREAARLDLGDWKPLAALCTMQLRTGQREAARVTRMDLERRFPERLEDFRDACRP